MSGHGSVIQEKDIFVENFNGTNLSQDSSEVFKIFYIIMSRSGCFDINTFYDYISSTKTGSRYILDDNGVSGNAVLENCGTDSCYTRTDSEVK